MRFVYSIVALLLIAASTEAGSISFQFQNVDGPVNGTVSGQIFLSGTGDGTFPATSIIVDTAPAALGWTLPFDVFAIIPQDLVNTFTVSAGQIVAGSSSFGRADLTNAFTLSYTGFGSLLTPAVAVTPFDGVVDTNNTTLTYGSAPAPVPEIDPAGLGSVLALIGGGLGLLERRRKRA